MAKRRRKTFTLEWARQEIIKELHKQGIQLSWVSKHNIDKAAIALANYKNVQLAKRRAKECP